MSRLYWILVLFLLAVAAGERPKRFVAFRKGSTFFYRLNYKVNMLPYTTIFAQASGFKVAWQLPEAANVVTSKHRRIRSSEPTLSADDLRDAVRLLYDRHGLDGQMCLMRSLCQAMQFVGKEDGVLGKILNLMAGFSGANNATVMLDPLVCRNYANHCPLHLLDSVAFAQH